MIFIIIILVLLIACGTYAFIRTKEKGKMDMVSGLSAAFCVGALAGLLLYLYL